MKTTILHFFIAIIITGQVSKSYGSSEISQPKFITIKGLTLGDTLTSCPKNSRPHVENKSKRIIGCYIDHTTFLGQPASLRFHAGEDRRINKIVVTVNEETSVFSAENLLKKLLSAYGNPTSKKIKRDQEIYIWFDRSLIAYTWAGITNGFNKTVKLRVVAKRAVSQYEKDKALLMFTPKSDL